MARARNIKPAFFTNEDLVDLPFQDRLLFIGLWTIADREGRLEDRPKRIKMEIFPADDVDVEASLERLQASGMIARYQVGDGRYIEVVNFTKHQRPHTKESPSDIPARAEQSPREVPEPTKDGASTDLGSGEHALIPDTGYLNADTGYPQPEPVREIAAAKPPDVVLDRFEQFWIGYPKRMGRDEALHAWRRIDWQKVTFEQIVEALGQHCRSLQWQKDGGQYIPRAAKWINERRWNEVLPEHAALPKSPPNIAGIDHSATTIDEDLAALFAAEGLTQ